MPSFTAFTFLLLIFIPHLHHCARVEIIPYPTKVTVEIWHQTDFSSPNTVRMTNVTEPKLFWNKEEVEDEEMNTQRKLLGVVIPSNPLPLTPSPCITLCPVSCDTVTVSCVTIT